MANPIEPSEIGRLFQKHAAALSVYALQWCDAPDECVQEAFIELAKQPQRPTSPVGWLYRVVRNRAFNAHRSARRRQRNELAAAMMTESMVRDDHVQEEQREELMRCLSQLADQDREIVVLKIWSEMTWNEIAGVTGISSSNAHRRYVRALEVLKEKLDQPCTKNSNYPRNSHPLRAD